MPRTLRAAAVLFVALPAVACSVGLPAPRFSTETPPESKAWTPIAGLPAWVESAPPREGWLRFVAEGKSNDRFIAAVRGGPARQLGRHVTQKLAPVVGADDAARAAAAAEASVTLVERVAKDEVLTRAMVPGNTLATVWTLCEVPLDTVLAPLPAEKRGAAREALLR